MAIEILDKSQDLLFYPCDLSNIVQIKIENVKHKNKQISKRDLIILYMV